MMTRMTFGDVSVEVEFKDIKHLHLNVFPPDGRVRISAPKRMGAATVRAFAVSKLAWIKRQRRKFCAQPREAGLEYIDRESHYVWGRRYLLKVVEAEGVPGVRWQSHRLVLQVRSGTGEAARAALMAEWYRAALRQAAAELILKWQPVLKVRAGKLYVQRMKTKWGSCNPERGSIRLNTELAKKPTKKQKASKLN